MFCLSGDELLSDVRNWLGVLTCGGLGGLPSYYGSSGMAKTQFHLLWSSASLTHVPTLKPHDSYYAKELRRGDFGTPAVTLTTIPASTVLMRLSLRQPLTESRNGPPSTTTSMARPAAESGRKAHKKTRTGCMTCK